MFNDDAEKLVTRLTHMGWHIVTMESCTGGGLANLITNVPGSSAVLMDSFITYSNEAKIRLGVPEELIEEHTVYSLEVAESMAEQAVAISIAGVEDIVGVGVTGSLTREDPNNPNSEPGKVYASVCMSDGVDSTFFDYGIYVTGDDREKGKEEILKSLLELILDNLQLKPEGGLLC